MAALGWLDILNGANPRPGYGVTVKDGEGLAQLSSPVTIARPVVDRGRMAVTAVLTTPSPDRQGDIVVPAGGDLAEHRLNPVVLFHHGKAGHLPIGKAEDPDGNYTVRLVKGSDGSDRLIGTTYFAQNNEESGRFAASVFGLIEEDILRGVSVGFDPVIDDEDPDTRVTKAIERLGPSARLDRDALKFNKWKLLEYSHTPIGVNREALTVAVHKALDGSRAMHPALLKYLAPMAAARKATVSVPAAVPASATPLVEKAVPHEPYEDDEGMDAGAAPPESPDEAPADDADDMAGGDQPTPTVRALLDAAQGAVDLADQIETQMQQAEHIRGRKHAKGLCEDLRKLAEKAKQRADEVTRELAGHEEKEEGGEEEGGESEEGGENPMERDEEGAIVTKAYPGFTPARWTRADLARATPVRPAPRPAPPAAPVTKAAADDDDVRAENAQLKATLQNLVEDLKAAGRAAARRGG